VGDNASTDDSLSYLRQNFPQVEVSENDKNYGYAGGYNQVLNQLDSDYFVLLNSDVEVTPGWIEPVIAQMETDEKIAAAQPKIRSYKQKDFFEYAGAAGGYIDKYGYPFCRGRIFDTVEKDSGQYDDKVEIFWASGAALFIKKKCWQEVGGFDADFFAHMEEIDLCWRLKTREYKIVYCPKSIVFHLGAGTLNTESPHKTYLNFRNNLAMLAKNLPAGQASRTIFVRFGLDLISLVRFGVQGKTGSALAISRAHTHFLRNLKHNRTKATKDKSNFNTTGLYRGSIVWDYFVRGKKQFGDL
jgi:hypothetical protein